MSTIASASSNTTIPFNISYQQPDPLSVVVELAKPESAAVADLVSIVRNLRFDMSQPPPKSGRRITEAYVLELGMRVLEVADAHFSMHARDWDAVLKKLVR
jgi:hypothetical protein